MSKGKILIVDDDNDARRLLCTMVKALGFEYQDFELPTEALESAKDTQYNIALLDVMMPVMNGFELLEKLKQLDNFKETPVVMVTAKDSDSDLLEGYQYGADYYITKPYTMKQIEYGLNMFISH